MDGVTWRRVGGMTEGVALATAARTASSGEGGCAEEVGRAGVEEALRLLGGGSGVARLPSQSTTRKGRCRLAVDAASAATATRAKYDAIESKRPS